MANFKLSLSLFFILLVSGTVNANEKAVITIVNTKGREVKLDVEIARTSDELQLGLMYRKNLPDGSGMLFVFDDEKHRNFWMKNTYLTLSIAYISRLCIINDIHDMKPLDTSITYPSRYPARYALEVNRGWFKKNSIGPGCRIIINGCIGKQDSIIGR